MLNKKNKSIIAAIITLIIIIAGLTFYFSNKLDSTSSNKNNFKMNNNKQPTNQQQPTANINITDGTFDKFEKGFLYIKEISRGPKIKKIKLTEETKYSKIILINKGNSSNPDFKPDKQVSIKKENFKKGDQISIMHKTNNQGIKIVDTLRKITIKQ